MGCSLDPIDEQTATERIIAMARAGGGSQIVTLGTEMVVYAQRDSRYRSVINACALSLCDTVGLLAAARRRGASLRRRVTGIELIELLCARAAHEDIPVYLLGGAPGVAEEAARALQARHTGLRVAGTNDGYFPDAESSTIAGSIKNSGAQILFAGMGFPRQEFWLADHLKETGCGAGIGVGGSFDVLAGKVQRAPLLWRRFGIEWLYRLVREPHRWRRQLALPKFVWLLACEGLRSR